MQHVPQKEGAPRRPLHRTLQRTWHRTLHRTWHRTLQRVQVDEWQSQFQNDAIPIPTFPPSDDRSHRLSGSVLSGSGPERERA